MLNSIEELVSVKKEHYDQCISSMEQTFTLMGVKGKAQFHYLKFDGNGMPMVKGLAEMLYRYIVQYCIASKNRIEPISFYESSQFVKEARNLFRHPKISDDDPDKTGEAGETLLFFLMEAILRAPQLVSKMELKTNHKDEVKGSDGIHMRWDETDKVVDFYFGESKLYQDVNSAISAALKSIDDFHKNEMYKHEFIMVTKHFKYANEAVRKEISKLIELGEPGPAARINHSCLIGYDWKKYNSLDSDNLKDDFLFSLRSESTKIVTKLNEKFSEFERKHLRFDVFFIPFPSVSDFRDAFNKALD